MVSRYRIATLRVKFTLKDPGNGKRENQMKNQILLISQVLFLLLALTACGPAIQAATPSSTSQQSLIQDPQLVAAWESLDAIQTTALDWKNQSLTGHELAQFLLERSIPVQFDFDEKCHGSSCSIRYCAGTVCDFEDGNPGVDPIYISMKLKGDPDRLVRALAHEIYHRTEPFGNVRDTLFEEYWAYATESQIVKTEQEIFTGYDPRNPEDLARWFAVNQAGYYIGFDLYSEMGTVLVAVP